MGFNIVTKDGVFPFIRPSEQSEVDIYSGFCEYINTQISRGRLENGSIMYLHESQGRWATLFRRLGSKKQDEILAKAKRDLEQQDWKVNYMYMKRWFIPFIWPEKEPHWELRWSIQPAQSSN